MTGDDDRRSPDLRVIRKPLDTVLEGMIEGQDFFDGDGLQEAIAELACLYNGNRIAYERRRNELQGFFGVGITKDAIDADVKAFIDRNIPKLPKPDDDPVSELIAIAKHEAVLWHNSLDDSYATFNRDGHLENHKVTGGKFKRFLSVRYGATHETLIDGQPEPSYPKRQQLDEAIYQIHHHALEGPEQTPRVRIWGRDTEVWIDLGSDDWSVVHATPDGWHVERRMSVPLIRGPAMKPLPIPERGGDIQELREFVNVPDESDFTLLCGGITTILNPFGNYHVILVSGPPGSAKTFIVRVIRDLTDPNEIDTRPPPREIRSLYHGASQTHVIGLENVQWVNEELSDALCRLSTKTGYSERKLYEQGTEWMAKLHCSVIINGIPSNIAEAPDLRDRIITFRCEYLGDEVRSEEGLKRRLERIKPRLFGCICDGIVAALKLRGEHDADNDAAAEALFGRWHTRFIDTVVWGEAACRGMGFPPGAYVEAYKDNKLVTLREIADTEPICIGIRRLVAKHGRWQGYPAQLLAELQSYCVVPTEVWLGRKLGYFIPILYQLHRIKITRNNRLHKDGNRNGIIIEVEPEPEQ